MFKALYDWLFKQPIKKTNLHRANDALKKVQDGIDEMESIFSELFSSWEKTFYVEIKEGRKIYKFDLGNPSTQEEYDRKKKDSRALLDLVIRRWLKAKSEMPFIKQGDTSFKEMIKFLMSPDPAEYKMKISSSKSYLVDIPKEQLEAWDRLRKIYFPEKDKDEVSK